MIKYRVKTEWMETTICTVAPTYRNGDGRFDLSQCTQRDFKYLYDVIRHPSIEVIVNEQQKKSAEKAE